MQQQPTVRHRLAALEREVGALLFERLGTGLALTSAGEASLPYAAQPDSAQSSPVSSRMSPQPSSVRDSQMSPQMFLMTFKPAALRAAQ